MVLLQVDLSQSPCHSLVHKCIEKVAQEQPEPTMRKSVESVTSAKDAEQTEDATNKPKDSEPAKGSGKAASHVGLEVGCEVIIKSRHKKLDKQIGKVLALLTSKARVELNSTGEEKKVEYQNLSVVNKAPKNAEPPASDAEPPAKRVKTDLTQIFGDQITE